LGGKGGSGDGGWSWECEFNRLVFPNRKDATEFSTKLSVRRMLLRLA